MITNYYIIRHGETAFNRAGIVQGSGVDSDLNDIGRNQAALFYAKYAAVPFDLILVSSLKRTAQTAAPFIEQGIKTIKIGDLNEINWGTHEGKVSSPEGRFVFRETVRAWSEGNYDARTTDGESAAELAARLERVKKILEGLTEKNVLVVTHGRTLRALTCLLKAEPLANMEQYDHSNTGLVMAHFDHENQTWQITTHNDISHLSDRPITHS